MAVVCNETNEVMLYMQIGHHGDAVKKNLDTQHMTRRNCRPKWGNKTPKKGSKATYDSPGPEGWAPLSVKSIATGILSWTDRFKTAHPDHGMLV